MLPLSATNIPAIPIQAYNKSSNFALWPWKDLGVDHSAMVAVVSGGTHQSTSVSDRCTRLLWSVSPLTIAASN